MSIKLPNLDDRTYADLVEEGRNIISTSAPEWTNHNPSDPGITLIELFAYYTEILNYRLNRVSEANMLAFLKLLNGPQWLIPETPDLKSEMRTAIRALRQRNRCVSSDDFEVLALEADENVARAQCIPRRDLTNESRRAEERPGHISVILVLRDPIGDPAELKTFHRKIENYFENKRLLTSRVHVTAPGYIGGDSGVGIRLVVVLKSEALEAEYTKFSIPISELELSSTEMSEELINEMLSKLVVVFKEAQQNKPEGEKVYKLSDELSFHTLSENQWLLIDNIYRQSYTVRQEDSKLYVYFDEARRQAMRALFDYFDPSSGGPKSNGWPFGRDIYVSELYQILDILPAVDYVIKAKKPDSGYFDEVFVVDTDYPDRRKVNDAEELVALSVMEHELVKLPFDQIFITVQRSGAEEL